MVTVGSFPRKTPCHTRMEWINPAQAGDISEIDYTVRHEGDVQVQRHRPDNEVRQLYPQRSALILYGLPNSHFSP